MIPAFSKPFTAPLVKPFGPPVAEFSPLDIPNLLAWYDATDPASITETSGDVSNWADKSGNGLDVAETINPPKTGTATINGLNAIEFNGGGDTLTRSAYPLTVDLTLACVFNVFAPVINASESLISFDATNDFQIDAGVIGGFFARLNEANLTTANLQASPGVSGDVLILYRFSSSEPSIELYVNNVLNDSTNNYAGNIDSSQEFRIAANRLSSVFLSVRIGELVFYGRDITTDERNELSNGLISKWGI